MGAKRTQLGERGTTSCFTDYKGLEILDSSHVPTGEAGVALHLYR